MMLDPNPSLFGISPGRFFVVNETKALIAHIFATFDVKFEEKKGVPPWVPRHVCIAGLRYPGKRMFCLGDGRIKIGLDVDQAII